MTDDQALELYRSKIGYAYTGASLAEKRQCAKEIRAVLAAPGLVSAAACLERMGWEDPAVCAAKLRGEMDYDSVTPLEWFKYELATLQHDYKINPEAVKIIEVMAKRLTRYDLRHPQV